MAYALQWRRSAIAQRDAGARPTSWIDESSGGVLPTAAHEVDVRAEQGAVEDGRCC